MNQQLSECPVEVQRLASTRLHFDHPQIAQPLPIRLVGIVPDLRCRHPVRGVIGVSLSVSTSHVAISVVAVVLREESVLDIVHIV
jgi:hypothetical protein